MGEENVPPGTPDEDEGEDDNIIDDGTDTISGTIKIPWPTEGPITGENDFSDTLLISINSNKIEGAVLSDNSGNQNLGMVVSDFKTEYDNETLKPKRKKKFNRFKSNRKNGAF